MKALKRISFPTWTVPIALLLLLLVSFGLLAPLLGLYWDDWPSIWYLHLLGPSGFQEVFAVDRPPLAWIFMLTTSLVGESPVAWQFFGIFSRWLSCLALLWVLRSVWPGRSWQTTVVVLLFAVYPGFQQQYISVTYSQDWLILAGFFVSFGLMIWAARQPRLFWLLAPPAWLLAAYAMFADEYYFGLELLRPVLLWLVLTPEPQTFHLSIRVSPETKARAWRILLHWAPYVALMAVFLVWRLFIYETPRGEVQVFEKVSTNPLIALFQLGRIILIDLIQVSAGAWGLVFNPSNLASLGRYVYVYAAVVLVTALAAILYLSGLRQNRADVAPTRPDLWAIQSTLIGLFALVIAGWPFWVTYLPIELKFPWDRFTLVMILGSSLLFAGLIELLVRRPLYKIILLGVVLSLAAGNHFQKAVDYRRDWELQKNLFWQLSWRIPGMQPGTTLITSELPFVYYSDNSLTAPLNWIYAPDHTGSQMAYLVYDINSRVGRRAVSMEQGQEIEQFYRATYFIGNTSRAVLFYYQPPRCLKVVDPFHDRLVPQKPMAIEDAQALSDPSLIVPDPQVPAQLPTHLFGLEPDPTWCYYYQQADLARQFKNWEAIPALGEKARLFLDSVYPDSTYEMVPFIQGYAYNGLWDEAREWTVTAFQKRNKSRQFLCAAWYDLLQNTPPSPERDAAVARVKEKVGCDIP